MRVDRIQIEKADGRMFMSICSLSSEVEEKEIALVH